jgi:hypothetical protein
MQLLRAIELACFACFFPQQFSVNGVSNFSVYENTPEMEPLMGGWGIRNPDSLLYSFYYYIKSGPLGS